MDYNGFSNAIIVAQAYHATRVGRMATKLQIEHDIPTGLPTIFDSSSEQPWIRNESAWQEREKKTIILFTAMGTMALRDK